MEAQCINADGVGKVLELPVDHPSRRHAETCPRCRSLVASYRLFLEAEPVDGSDIDRARRMLDAHITADASRWKPAGAPVRSFRWQRLLRPVPIFAALVVIVAAGLWMSREPEEGSLRDSAARSPTFALRDAEIDSAGAIRLGWSGVAGADQYQVRIYGPDFGEIYRSANTAGTSLMLERSALPQDLPLTLDLTWRVYAFSQGDVIATSAPGSIRTR